MRLFHSADPSIAAFLFLVGVAMPAYAFTTLDYPGSIHSSASGIDGATIVGWQQPVMQPGVFPSGYLHDGTFNEFQFPGSHSTMPRDISGNKVVGSYQNGATFVDESFLYDNGTWAPLNHPDYYYTWAESIDGNKVVGWLDNGPGSSQGFIYDGAWTTVSHPAATSTSFFGIDGTNIVGSYIDENYRSRGFLYDGTNWKALDFPGATDTNPRAISGSNIVGSYVGPSGVSRGFRYDGRFWHTLQVPSGVTSSSNNGIDGQTIVGQFSSGGVTHGFSTPIDAEVPQEYKFAIRGIVTAVEDAGERFNGAYKVGDPIDVTYNYFDDRFQRGSEFGNEAAQSFTYFARLGGSNFFNLDPAPIDIRLTVGDTTLESGSVTDAALNYELRITNDDDGASGPFFQVGDTYRLHSPLAIPESFSNVGNARLTTNFVLHDPTGMALSSLDLPTDAPGAAKFASRIGRINLTNASTFESLARVEYRIDSIVAVPEPASGFAAALTMLGTMTFRLPRYNGQFGTKRG